MGKRKAQQRLLRVKNPILRGLKWLASIIILLLGIIWASAQDRYLGNPVMNALEKFWESQGISLLGSLIERIMTYPVETSVTVLVMTLAVVIALAYWETRDPKGITINTELAPIINGSPDFSIINNSGSDLIDCGVAILKIDDVDIRQRDLNWGKPFYNSKRYINIINTGKGDLYLRGLINDIKKSASTLPFEGLHEVELIFHANTKLSETITWPILVKVEIKLVQVEEGNQPKLFLKNVTT